MYTTLFIIAVFILASRNFSDTKRYIWLATALALVNYIPQVNPLYFALLITSKTVLCWILVDIAHHMIPANVIWRWSLFGQQFMFATATANAGTGAL